MIPIPECPFGNKVTNVCIYEGCFSNPFMCSSCQNKDCIQLHTHEHTTNIKWNQLNGFLQLIQEQKMQKKCLVNRIRKRMQIILKNMKDLVGEQINLVQKYYSSRIENSQTANILSKIKQRNYCQVKGVELKRLIQLSKKKKKQKQIYDFEKLCRNSIRNIVNNTFQKLKIFLENEEPQNFQKHLKQKVLQLEINEKQIPNMNQQISKKYKLLTQQIKNNPNNWDHLFERATLFQQYNYCKQAQIDYNRCVEINPSSWSLFYNRAVNNYNQNKYKEAEEDFTKSIQIKSQNPFSYYNRALIKHCSKRYTQAMADYNKAIQFIPNDQDFLYNRALLFENLDKLQQAIKDYNSILELSSTNWDVKFKRAVLYQKLKRYKQAIQEYTILIKQNEFKDDSYNNRGLINKILGNYSQSEQDFNKAIDLQNLKAKYYNNRASLFFHLQRYRQAERDFKKAIELQPDNGLYFENKSILLSKIHDKENQKITPRSLTKLIN